MNRFRLKSYPWALLREARGFAMVLTAIITILFLSLLGASLMFSGLNLKTATQFRTGGTVFHVADAGIQHALATVNQGSAFTYTSETTVLSQTTFPTGSAYSYTVKAINGPGANQATLTSTANGPNDTKAVVAVVVERRTLPSIPGVFSILGEAEGYFSGTNFVIDGNDYDLDGNSTGNPAKKAITVGDISSPSSQTATAALNNINDALSTDQKNHHILGDGRDQATNTPSTGIDNSLTKQTTKDFVDFLKGIADSYVTVQSNGGDVTGTVSNSTDVNNNLDLGSRTINMGTTNDPRIVFFQGLPEGTSGQIQLKFTGTIKGAGILVMRDNDLLFSGGLDWKGLIIVTGPDTALGLQGSSEQKLLGAAIINETDTDSGYIELYMSNTASSTYRRSQAALDMVQSMINNKASLKIVSWKQQFSS
jgi:hypothetical protein